MKKYIVFMYVGFCGMDGVEALCMDDNHTQEELENAVWEMAVNHAEMYGYYPEHEAPEDYDPDSEDFDENSGDNYVDSIEGYAEEYDPEKHDGHSIGGSWDSEFERQAKYFN